MDHAVELAKVGGWGIAALLVLAYILNDRGWQKVVIQMSDRHTEALCDLFTILRRNNSAAK